MNQPLVTIWIITYNSSCTILEALESAKAQTYPNIELVISDDCSTDNTVELCENWLKENSKYFKRTALVTSPVNTGVAPNCNRAIKASTGDWLKVLAGDDLLFPYSIEEYVNYTKKYPQEKIFFSNTCFWGDDPEFIKKVKNYNESTFNPKIQLDHKSQYKANLKSFFLPGPSLFYAREVYDKIGGYDETFPMNEEDSFADRIFEAGYHVQFAEKELYRYRVSHTSLCRGDQKMVHYLGREKYYYTHLRKKLIKHHLYLSLWYTDSLYKYLHRTEEKSKLHSILISLSYYIHPERWFIIPKALLTKLSH